MLKLKKVDFQVLIMSIVIIAILSYMGNNLYVRYEENRSLFHDELVEYINKYCLSDIKANNFKVVLEKDFDDVHILMLSYNTNINSNQMIGLAIFKRLTNGKYKYDRFQSDPFIINSTVLTQNTGKKDEKNYTLFWGIITDSQPNKYIITRDGKEFAVTFQRNKFFVEEYEMGKTNSLGMRPAYE